MKKNRVITFCAVTLSILCVLFLYGQRRAIFQRGNPIPYLRAAAQLSEEHPYVAVDEARGIYISKRGEYLELFEFFQDELDVEFVEQAGSGYGLMERQLTLSTNRERQNNTVKQH